MQDAINEFAGSPEEAKISIANADLALSRGDSDQALVLLKTITEDKPYYIQAKEKMAQLYFTHR
jgi:tetratricopeptide repeat protein 21B